jgi:predicted nucleic acid-binding protein
VSQDLAAAASDLSLEHELRSLDSLHLAAALTLPRADLLVATWDKRLRAAVRLVGLALLPAELD